MGQAVNLDTVLFSIPILEKNIKEWERFRWAKDRFPVTDVDAFYFELGKHTNAKLMLHFLNTDRLGANWHYPTVTLRKKEDKWTVWIEGSLSKFYFGSNLFEFISFDFESVVKKLYYFLHDNGLCVEKVDIYEAVMYKADISKVLLIDTQIPILKVLEFLGKIDLDVRNETHIKEYVDFRQGGKGHAVIWGTSKKKLASIYDKLMELQHNPNKTTVEKNIITFLEKNKDCVYQILKFEECLHDKIRLNYVCNKITRQNKNYYTFADFWERDLIKKLLLFRGERLFSGADVKILLLGNNTPSQIQQKLKSHDPKIRAGRLSNIGFWTLLAYELGMKEMKKQLKVTYSPSTQHRILQQTRFLMATMTRLPMQEVFDNFYKQLQEMKPIRATTDLLSPLQQ